MTPVLAGPFYGSCLLLAGAGAEKAGRPADTARVLRRAGVQVPASLVRAGGAAEAAIGSAAILTGNRLLAGTVALSYLAFAAFVVWAMWSHSPLSSCGCFGRADTPPTLTHVFVDLACGAVAADVALFPPFPDLGRIVTGQPGRGLPLVALSAAAAFGTFLVLSPAARLRAQRRGRP